MQEVAAGPPNPFQLTETNGDTHLSLTREYNGELISVDLMVG